MTADLVARLRSQAEANDHNSQGVFKAEESLEWKAADRIERLTAPLADAELEEIEAAEKAATPGPWMVGGATHVFSAGPDGANICSASELRASTKAGYTEPDIGSKDLNEIGANADFIALSRTAVPRLLTALRAARAENEKLKERVAKLDELTLLRATYLLAREDKP